MTVPDEAVEAAARAAYERVRPLMGFPTDYDEAPSYLQDTYRNMSRAALAAAAPFIAAQAWDEGFDKGSDWGEWAAAPIREEPADQTANPYRSK